MIMNWFQAYDSVSETSAFSGFNLVKFETVAKWVDKSKKSRAPFIAQYVPKSLEPPAGTFTRQFLKRYGADKEVREALMRNFATESWNGEASVHYQMKMERMIAIRKGETEPNLVRFLDDLRRSLSKLRSIIGELSRSEDATKYDRSDVTSPVGSDEHGPLASAEV